MTEYWPDFARNGKSSVTIADVLRHESGLAYFTSTFGVEDMRTENIKRNKTVAIDDSGILRWTAQAEQEQVRFLAISLSHSTHELTCNLRAEGHGLQIQQWGSHGGNLPQQI